MRLRIFLTVSTLVAVAGAGTLIARGGTVCERGGVCCVENHACCGDSASSCRNVEATPPTKQWSIVNLPDPILVNRTLVSGPVMIEHDDGKMANGEACTTFYRFEPGVGPKEALVSFHCAPRRGEKVSSTRLVTQPTDTGIKCLTEYQIAGDSEIHGVSR